MLKTKSWRDPKCNNNMYRWFDIHDLLTSFKYDKPKRTFR